MIEVTVSLELQCRHKWQNNRETCFCFIMFHMGITAVSTESHPPVHLLLDSHSCQKWAHWHQLFMRAHPSFFWPVVTQTHPLNFDVRACFPTNPSTTLCASDCTIWLRNVCHHHAWIWRPEIERRTGRGPPVTRHSTPENKPYTVLKWTPLIHNKSILYRAAMWTKDYMQCHMVLT